MRHAARSRKLGRTSAHRKAMYRNMVTSLLQHERIQTTDAKAKEVRRLAERMITLGKRGSLHARRRALRVIRSRDVTAKVFDDLAERYRERPGGYTRVLKIGPRRGDAAALSLVELVEGQAAPEPRGRKAAKKARAGKAPAAKGATGAASKKTAAKKTTKKAAGKATKKAATRKAGTKKAATKKSGTKKAGTRKATPKKKG
jgi:large subunit ribosomal protein L17